MIRSLFGSILRLGRTFTPPIGTPNGIAELKPVELNGYPQWLLIRGQDVSKPVLLYLHGGPGEPNMWSVHHTMRELERRFVCVNWDQRGAGRSLRPGPDPATMTVEQFVSDTIALIELLLSRFGQKKLFLLGHSWGSILAMKVAAARPELLHAVIGMGQCVDSRGEDLSYRYVLERARAEHNQKAIRILEQLGGSDTYGKSGKFIQRRWLFRYGGLVHSLDLWALASILFDAREYSIGDCIRYLRMSGLRFSIPRMGDELLGVNLLQEVPELSVPVWFFEGRHDYTAPFVLAQQFYDSLAAPSKRLVWFEESAHPLDVEEPEKFQRELIAIAEECLPRKDPQEAKGEGRARTPLGIAERLDGAVLTGMPAGEAPGAGR
jgi:pimeloyl-ACP methyl ester carboxylesterase